MKEVILQSVELAGFKSFAKRTKIEFGADFCAIVGPNGSGKSNIADAIRWVLGEQKSKLLRTQKSEEVVYHGSKSGPRASMAEVTLTLNNSSGKIPLDFSEIEITRRLYRSGESNYLLNGKRVRAGYLQELLSKSKFGAGSYTVIGQGMIDKLILSSGPERKLLFDQASGIKHFEIKLAQTRSKLEQTKTNLSEISQLLQQLSPQHTELNNQFKTLQKKEELQKQLNLARKGYLISQKHANQQKLKDIQSKTQDLNQKYITTKNKMAELKAKQNQMAQQEKKSALVIEKNRKVLEQAEIKRDKLIGEVSILAAQLQSLQPNHKLDTKVLEQLDKQIKSLNLQHKQLLSQAKKLQKKVSDFDNQIAKLDEKIVEKTDLLNSVRKQLGASQKKEYLTHALGLLDLLQKNLLLPNKQSEIKVIFYKLHRMIRHSLNDDAAKLALDIGRIQNLVTHYLTDREAIVESQTNDVIHLRSVELDILSSTQAIKDLKTQQNQLRDVNKKHNQDKTVRITKQLNELEKQKDHLDIQITQLRDQLTAGANSNTAYQQFSDENSELITLSVKLDEQRKQFVAEQKQIESDLAQLQSLNKSWFGLSSIPTDTQIKPVTWQRVQQLEAEVLVLEDVSPEIQKQLQSTSKQVEFLENQQQDLQAAINNLETVANDLEKKIHKTFEQNFTGINNNFSRYFKVLFGGGDASLDLDEQAEGSFGVEISVQLPNKKSQNINSLSGGEKALVSVALLCGILATNPSPFIVLDEVDAALDERNTLKFADILRDISTKSQVLVITHNHDTMAIADELVGVTTTQKGDSQILRVALSQAQQLRS